ncbi:MAG: hypothetical protein R3223_13535, partial [Longimicrobiales bacterium]|nr:hypothetical protein [Longimicrobiales bacterium]
NDRLTEHYARHTVSWIREDAENPYGMSWGWDLEELVVRYGAEMGWNRTTTSAGSLRPANVVGHHHPESRHFLPPGPALADPTGFEEAGWRADGDAEGSSGADRPTTAYAPAYAPDLRFEPFQLARFRRGEEMILVAGFRVPRDTTRSDRADDGTGIGVRAGLFVFGPDGGVAESPAYALRSNAAGEGEGGDAEGEAGTGEEDGPPGVTATNGSSGAFHLRVPMGSYLVSVEVWDSASARAARLRRGVSLSSLPPDVAAISDLLILEAPSSRDSSGDDGLDPESGLPQELERALPLVRPLAELCPGGEMAVGWELTGIGFRREAVAMGLRLEKTDRSFFSRVGDFLGLSSPPEPMTLEWTEQGPGEPRPFFRSVRLRLPPEMEAGAYRLTVEARLPGRNPLETVRRVRIPEDGSCRDP